MHASSRFLLLCGLVFALLVACGACGPGAFENLTSGPADAGLVGDADTTLLAPRPIAPISVSVLPTLRPRLRWEIKGNLTGAVVEMCRMRGCTTVDKTFVAPGSELVVPEDLATGVWFWRLRGRSGDRVSTVFSPTWELVVRGGGKGGSSDAPQGMMLDLNGDGEADFVATGVVNDNAELFVWFGQPGGTLPETPSFVYDRLGAIIPGSIPVVAGGTDVNGDGFADAYVGLQVPDTDPTPYGIVQPILGGADGVRPAEFHADLDGYDLFGRAVREAGDVDGDGYGDIVVGALGDAFVVLGEPEYPVARKVIPIVFGEANEEGIGRVVLGAFDSSGDGASDVLVSSDDEDEAAILSASEKGTVPLADDSDLGPDFDDPGQATALAAGDLDGNGLAEVFVAGSTPTQSYVCLYSGGGDREIAQIDCKTSTPDKSTFGVAATSLDLDGDGTEEIVMSSKAPARLGLDVVRLSGTLAFEPITDPGLGASLSTIWPGRPGPGRWAAASAEADEIVVFENTTRKQVLKPPPGKTFSKSIR